jgi:uncharacterized DUF497 family protein
MNEDDFEWDEAKARLNIRNHGLSFEVVREAFDDFYAYEWADEREDYGEERFNITGMVRGRLITVTYTMRGEKFRLISASKAEPRERRLYHEQAD